MPDYFQMLLLSSILLVSVDQTRLVRHVQSSYFAQKIKKI